MSAGEGGEGEARLSETATHTHTLMLPTIGDAPLVSPGLIREEAPEEEVEPGALVLSPWEVQGIALSAAQVVSWLSLLPECRVAGHPAAMTGASLRFWSVVSKFAMELLARQRFVPSVGRYHRGKVERFTAVWLPLIEDTGESPRVALLAETMPPLCRALVSCGAGEAPSTPPAAGMLVESFLNAAVDGTIRQWLSEAEQGAGKREARYGQKHSVLTAAEKWNEALWAEDPTIHAPAKELRKLEEEIHSWTAQLHAPEGGAAFRTCFRLDPPPATEDTLSERHKTAKGQDWAIRFFLQATDDRSLLVPVDKVWKESKSTLQFLNRKFDHPQERLLGDLGRASRLFPAIEESLRSARPEACYLTTEEAYAFLREAAPLLEETGFSVLVPPWWEKPRARLGVRLRLRPKSDSKVTAGQSHFGLNSIVNFDWELALGEESLSWEEFEKLAALKVPLVQIRGQWVELRPDQIEAAIRFWKERRNRGDMLLAEALRLGLGQQESEAGLPVVGVEVKGWIAELCDRLTEGEKIAELPQPLDFCGKLRPYQVRGFSWLWFLRQWGLGACLADDMGLGKTIQFIALLLYEKACTKSRRRRSPVLLICPTSVVGNWQREVARFAPSVSVLVHHGAERHSGKDFVRETKKHDLVISTYALAHRDEKCLSAVEWAGIALDEAQNIKNPAAKQTQAIRRLEAGYRIALTGTPVENRLSELWSIMEFLNPGYLSSATDFRRRFALPIERYQDPESAVRLRRLVQPFILRRLKTDPKIIQDLPEKLEMKVFCQLTREQATLYEAVVQEMLKKIEESEGIERKGLVLSTLMKLKQVCNHPAHFLGDGSALDGRSGKLTRLEEMLDEVLSEGHRALIFTQFSEMGKILKGHLQGVFGCEVLFLHGQVAQKARDHLVTRFQEEVQGPPIFILSLKAGGLGLNLTRASHVFHFDRWWNPAVENQATDRVFRIGQKKNVQVHKFVCSGTLEERIDEMIESKKALAENIVGTGEAWLTEMSTDQLRSLLALSRDAVESE
ncbi:DEAD/DEAH box helicase [Candidatus Hakubella thermalkaliphila]|nr:DEAD/DEAH box helicase [Candidatus Hakubella thermalkaliphila]